MAEDKEIIPITVDSDEELDGTWLLNLLDEYNIPYTKTYVHEEFLYELEYIPKIDRREDYFVRYTILYDKADDYHMFNKFLIHKYSKKATELENLLDEDMERLDDID